MVLPCLLIGGPETSWSARNNAISARHGAPFVAVERLLVESGGLALCISSAAAWRGVEVESERDRHTDAGGGKSIVPAQAPRRACPQIGRRIAALITT